MAACCHRWLGLRRCMAIRRSSWSGKNRSSRLTMSRTRTDGQENAHTSPTGPPDCGTSCRRLAGQIRRHVMQEVRDQVDLAMAVLADGRAETGGMTSRCWCETRNSWAGLAESGIVLVGWPRTPRSARRLNALRKSVTARALYVFFADQSTQFSRFPDCHRDDTILGNAFAHYDDHPGALSWLSRDSPSIMLL
jgi:hypothetical protein